MTLTGLTVGTLYRFEIDRTSSGTTNRMSFYSGVSSGVFYALGRMPMVPSVARACDDPVGLHIGEPISSQLWSNTCPTQHFYFDAFGGDTVVVSALYTGSLQERVCDVSQQHLNPVDSWRPKHLHDPPILQFFRLYAFQV